MKLSSDGLWYPSVTKSPLLVCTQILERIFSTIPLNEERFYVKTKTGSLKVAGKDSHGRVVKHFDRHQVRCRLGYEWMGSEPFSNIFPQVMEIFETLKFYLYCKTYDKECLEPHSVQSDTLIF